MHNFRELEVWKKAIQLCKDFYLSSQSFPKEELFGLTSQARRSAYSIPSNIAEGAGRDSSAQFAHFLNIALGSAFEFETQILISNELELLNEKLFLHFTNDIRHIQNMIIKLKQSLTLKENR